MRKEKKDSALDSDSNSNEIHRWHYTSNIICCIKVTQLCDVSNLCVTNASYLFPYLQLNYNLRLPTVAYH